MLVKTKRLIPLALALLLTVSPVKATDQSLIDPEQVEDQQATYNTAQVQLGSFAKESSATATVYYPLQNAMKLDANGAIFAEFTVKEGQKVSKGDVLARFTMDASSVALERLEREIAHLESETKLGVSQRNEAIKLLKNTPAEGLEKEKNSILLKKAEAELAHYQYLQQRSLDALKLEKKAEQEKKKDYTIVAPEDGKVAEFAALKTGDPVAAGQTVMTFIRTDVAQLLVQNTTGDLRYNMPVVVTMGSQNNSTVLTGRVVAADGAIAQEEQTGFAYICVDTDKTLMDSRIKAEVIRLDNVLVTDRSAVIKENGRYYVTKLVDGMLQKRYVGFGLNNTENAWIIHGVADGDTLIAD